MPTPGNAYTMRTISPRPFSRTCARGISPSPNVPFVSGTLAAGSIVRVVYDYGASYRGTPSTGLSFAMVTGTKGLITRIDLSRWDGAAWQVELDSGSGGGNLLASMSQGSINLARDSASSYVFKPGGVNTGVQYFAKDALAGQWCRISDSANTIEGRVLGNDPGQFSTGGQQLAIELDPSTVIEGPGTFAALATSTATGSVTVYSNTLAVVGRFATETQRYYRLRMYTPAQVTNPEIGIACFGAFLPFSRPYRDGSSVRRLSPAEVSTLPGVGYKNGRIVRPGRSRSYELPFDQIVAQSAGSTGVGSTVLNQMGYGSNPFVACDSEIITIGQFVESEASAYPLGMLIDGRFAANPWTTDQAFTQGVVWGRMQSTVDHTAAKGFLDPREANAFGYGGTSIVFTEEI